MSVIGVINVLWKKKWKEVSICFHSSLSWQIAEPSTLICLIPQTEFALWPKFVKSEIQHSTFIDCKVQMRGTGRNSMRPYAWSRVVSAGGIRLPADLPLSCVFHSSLSCRNQQVKNLKSIDMSLSNGAGVVVCSCYGTCLYTCFCAPLPTAYCLFLKTYMLSVHLQERGQSSVARHRLWLQKVPVSASTISRKCWEKLQPELLESWCQSVLTIWAR